MKDVKKQHLPTKICPTCQRSFTCRKKWERNWEDVLYCSKKCSSHKNQAAPNTP